MKNFSCANHLWDAVEEAASQIEASKTKKATSFPEAGTAVVDNTEYSIADAVNTYTFTWPEGDFEIWARFTTGETPVIAFPATTKYIGGAPTFDPNLTYEMSVKNSVVVVAEVTAE